MKAFHCTCKTRPALFFESSSCTVCGRTTGLTDSLDQVQAFDYDSERQVYFLAESPEQGYRKCQNFAQYQVCNGMILAENKADSDGLCFSCRFNATIPNLDVPEHLPLWRKMETAKRRALYTLKALGLPLLNGHAHPEQGLTFDFTVDRSANSHFESALPGHAPVMTGHDCGHITINLAEADEVARSKTMLDMGERYRTLLGHFRHELGHFYFDRLIAVDASKHELCKRYFGDDEQDYQQALDRHYQQGAPHDWPQNFISEYATMHPWEDWAETWAHYMHILDTLETAQCAGVVVHSPRLDEQSRVKDLQLPQNADYFNAQTDFDTVLSTWMRFAVVLNSLNRSMGLPDAYPFVLTEQVRQKLKVVHLAVHNQLQQLQ